jgi:tetratricopeptide (TPR) repeat protein
MKKLNLKLLLGIVLATVVAAVAVFFIHKWQVSRKAGSLVTRADEEHDEADQLLEEGEEEAASEKLREAIKLRGRYLMHRPDDIDQRAKYAAERAKITELPGAGPKDFGAAVEAYRRAMNLDSENNDLRMEFIEYAMKIGRFPTATDHLQRLLDTDDGENDPQVKNLLAECLAKTGEHPEAKAICNGLIGYDETTRKFDTENAPAADNIDTYKLLSAIYREKTLENEHADLVMEQAAAFNDENYLAHLEYARYLLRWYRNDEEKRKNAREHIDRARELAPKIEGTDVPKDIEVVLIASEMSIAEKDFDRSKELLDEALEHFSEDHRIHRDLAYWSLQQNNREQAMKRIEAGLEVSEEKTELRYLRARLLLDAGEVDKARESIQDLENTKLLPHYYRYLTGRLAVLDKKWLDAANILEKVRPLMAGDSRTVMEIDRNLGVCYEQLKQPDRALESYDAVLQANPGDLQAYYAKARVLDALGQHDEANTIRSRIAGSIEGAETKLSPAVLEQTVRSKIGAQLRQLPEDREWKEIEEQIATLEKTEKYPKSSVTVLKIELARAQGDSGGALELVKQGLRDYPENKTLWLMGAELYAQSQGAEAGLKIADRMQEKFGDDYATRSLRAQLLVPARGSEAVSALEQLALGIEGFTSPQQVALLRALANQFSRLGENTKARDLISRSIEIDKNDLSLRLALLDMVLRENDDDEAKRVIADLAKVIGKDNATWRYAEARRLLSLLRHGQAEAGALEKADLLVTEALQDRPNWQPLVQLQAQVALHRDNIEAAVNAFERSLELGPVRPEVVRGIVQMMVDQGNYEQAKKTLNMLPAGNRSLNDERTLAAIEIQLGQNVDDVLKRISAKIPDDSENTQDHLWLGKMRLAAGNIADAEESFQRVVELSPALPDGWLALVQTLVAQNRLADALATIRQANLQLPESRAPLVLGQCYEMARDLAMAEHHYKMAAEADPNNKTLLRRLANLYITVNQADKATEYLNRLLEDAEPNAGRIDPNVAWARRAKAGMQAKAGAGYQDYLAAIRRINENVPKGGVMLPEDLLLVARLALSRPDRASHQNAIKRLEEVKDGDKRRLTVNEQLALAQLYDKIGKWYDANELMISLIGKTKSDRAVVAPYCEMLLRHNDPNEVERWLRKLDEKSAEAISIKAHMLVLQDKPDEAVKLLNSLLPREITPANLGNLRAIAGLMEELGLYDEAEKKYRQFVRLQPQAVLELAAFLGRRGKIQESFEICETVKRDVPITAITQIGVDALGRLEKKDPNSPEFQQVRGWFEKGMRESPDSRILVVQLALFESMLDNTERVIEVYKDFLEREQANARQRAIVQNNLAFVLAMEGEGDEALSLINEAISEMGPMADLLDTRAMAHLANKDADSAKTDLEKAIAENDTPEKRLHLAEAEFLAKNREAAAEALRTAIDTGLNVEKLSKQEQAMYHRLKSALLPEPAGA